MGHQFHPRIAFYSHDTFGLGHITRTLRLGRAVLDAVPGATVLVLTGSPIAHRLVFPEGMEYVKLPSVRKRGPEEYASRDLGIPFWRLRRMRMQILRDTLRAFRPHLFFVDNVPLGMKGEILPSLEELKRSGTAIHLNLRDILDEPQVVRDQWRADETHHVLRSLYDEIHVFGDPSVHDAIRAYELPEDRTEFRGYLAPSPPSWATIERARQAERTVLVTIGGGEDGIENVRCAIDAARRFDPNGPVRLDVVLGPLMGSSDAQSLLRQVPHGNGISVREYVENLSEAMPRYDLVLSMGGYNTLSEVMARARRSIVIPRIHPRREQELRARALEARGVVRMIHPDERTPERLRDALHESLERGPVLQAARTPPLDGILRFRRRMTEIAALWTERRRLRCEARVNGPGRDRAHALTRTVVVAAALLLSHSSFARAADLGPRTLTVEGLFGYDSNILDASEAEIRAFYDHDPSSFFVVDRMSDVAALGSVVGRWRLPRQVNGCDLRLGYARLQYLHEPIRTENRYSAQLRSRFGPRTQADLGVEFAPNIYSRHRLDKDALPGEPIFRAEVRSEWNSSLQITEALAPSWASVISIEGSTRDYHIAFNERDRWRTGARSGLIWQKPGGAKIALSGGYRRVHSRNIPYLGSDLSYREWSLLSSFEGSCLAGFFRFGGYLNRDWRHYLSTDPNDKGHFGREDLEWDLGGFLQHTISRSLDWKAAVDHMDRSAHSALVTVDLDEEGSVRDTFVSTGFAWHWQR